MQGSDGSVYDAMVIGAGITGIYQLHMLRQKGFSVLGVEAGDDVGGVWHWNRFPGARLDTESYTYGYFAMNGIIPEWEWSEHFATQAEILSYIRAAADKMGVRDGFRFNTRVVAADYDENANLWSVRLDDGTTAKCRFLITAVGPLSATKLPDYPGIDDFKGVSYHSSQWPADPDGGTGPARVDFTGKRVGVIGTGATGIQIIPIVAQTAKELTVFQRSPNWCVPLGNTALTQEDMAAIREKYPDLLEYCLSTPSGFKHMPRDQDGIDATPEERQAFLEQVYSTPGYAIWHGNYRDFLISRETNNAIGEFIAAKIRARVKDPAVADLLIPKDHPYGTKRVPMETQYYETYNRPNVHLVDLNATPIDRITPDGIRTSAAEHELDIIIYATGFDAVTGALDRIYFRGRGGKLLRDAWADGPETFLGLSMTDFPNLFTLVSAHNGASFCNVGVCSPRQVEWVTEMLENMRAQGHTVVEALPEAQIAWTEHVLSGLEGTLLWEGDAWWMKISYDEAGNKIMRALAYFGGGPEYRRRCEEVAAHDYQGYALA
jgi:cation diffusion facilitator CzcD-associated flavoprotein CzcO